MAGRSTAGGPQGGTLGRAGRGGCVLSVLESIQYILKRLHVLKALSVTPNFENLKVGLLKRHENTQNRKASFSVWSGFLKLNCFRCVLTSLC